MQRSSGLGLDSQEQQIKKFITPEDNLIKIYIETGSGKDDERVQLDIALKECKKNKAKLLISHLDRLSRRVSFISKIMESGIDFISCDNPYATKFNNHILAAMAEFERDMISKRTKLALAAKKARGEKVGNGDYISKKNIADANEFAEKMKPIINPLMHLTPSEISRRLNAADIATYRGRQWQPVTVFNIIKRIDKLREIT